MFFNYSMINLVNLYFVDKSMTVIVLSCIGIGFIIGVLFPTVAGCFFLSMIMCILGSTSTGAIPFTLIFGCTAIGLAIGIGISPFGKKKK